MWCDILTTPKQGSAFRVFMGYLMNIPKDYDDEAERLLAHPLLLPNEDISGTITASHKAVLQFGDGSEIGTVSKGFIILPTVWALNTHMLGS